MATKQTPTTEAPEATLAESETRLSEALAKVKEASHRHAAIVSVTSRLGVSPQERRLAQSESKKVDRQLSDARRLLREAQMAARATKEAAAR